jgi:hypothetical protein
MSGASADVAEKAMNVEPCELGRYRPVSELQVLAAVERAQRHLDKVFHRDIAEHLGFKNSGATTRRLRPQLESLRDHGSLASERLNRLSEVWTITRLGRGRLAAARRGGAIDPLPESPQHRTWRHARETAFECLEEICGEVLAALAEADQVLGGGESRPGDSTQHFEVGKRLEREFSRLGVAIHCLHEWPEPDDACELAERPDGEESEEERAAREESFLFAAHICDELLLRLQDTDPAVKAKGGEA